MIFKDRTEAGEKLAEKLLKYKVENPIIYALPRGGVILGKVIAKKLNASLDIIAIRKIGHPFSPEYAIGAVSEDGHSIWNEKEKVSLDQKELDKIRGAEEKEAKRRREVYTPGRKITSPENKVVILVDDGIATGLTMEAAIKEIKENNPKKVIIAIPVAPPEATKKLKEYGVELEILDIDKDYLGAVGAYYQYFPQVEDSEVIEIMKKYL